MSAVQLACAEVVSLLPAARDWLSTQERTRLAQLRTQPRREQFLAARWLARQTLARALGGAERDWELTAPHDAPPSVAGHPELFLSVSHSGAWAACAVGREPLGLDLEAPRRQRDIGGLVAVCCTEREQAWVGADEALFYAVWTVKEAWLKRRHEWIAPARLRQIEVGPDGQDARSWRGEGWTLALCCAAQVEWQTAAPVGSLGWSVSDSSDVSSRA